MWKTIFSLADKGADFEKPLSPGILADASNPFVKTMIYIYSMQTFLFSEINKASRMKDESKIKFYGPFASALGFIVHCGNKKKDKFNKPFTVYRGFQASKEDLHKQFTLDAPVNLLGFISTTLSLETALKFSTEGINPSKEGQ